MFLHGLSSNGHLPNEEVSFLLYNICLPGHTNLGSSKNKITEACHSEVPPDSLRWSTEHCRQQSWSQHALPSCNLYWLYRPQTTTPRWFLLLPPWGLCVPCLTQRLVAEYPRPPWSHAIVSPLVICHLFWPFSISFSYFETSSDYLCPFYLCILPSATSSMRLPPVLPESHHWQVTGHRCILSTQLLLHPDTQTTEWASMYFTLFPPHFIIDFFYLGCCKSSPKCDKSR